MVLVHLQSGAANTLFPLGNGFSAPKESCTGGSGCGPVQPRATPRVSASAGLPVLFPASGTTPRSRGTLTLLEAPHETGVECSAQGGPPATSPLQTSGGTARVRSLSRRGCMPPPPRGVRGPDDVQLQTQGSFHGSRGHPGAVSVRPEWGLTAPSSGCRLLGRQVALGLRLQNPACTLGGPHRRGPFILG